MGAGWDHKPWDPDVERARPPLRPRTDWVLVGVYTAPIILWTIAILLVLVAKGWV
jgi:hypothetical protein